uniref:PAK1-interacting protein 1-like n=1 Tax=Schistosoma japonicum TaxID=6182 RepID=C1LIK8_SCHJA|nr:PAK1-interacting protein 1-like [Schistosoma japonicum]
MFSVIVSCGTYDGSVFASEYIHRTIDFSGPKLLKPLFVDPTAHTSPVTSVATKDSVVLSGSSDEIIQT